MHKQILSSKILSFIREMVLKITKIQTFALFYLYIINKTAVDAGHTPSRSFCMHQSFLYQNKLFTSQPYVAEWLKWPSILYIVKHFQT